MPPGMPVTEYFTAVSHYVKATRTGRSGIPTVVLHPIVNTTTFSKATMNGLCEKYGKKFGGKLVGKACAK